ncbi:hypothetical protein EZV62_002591 [Acer yangbiense]|uniref:RNase H type-1 domain-containing protein n=1 Tax=Acer yangbiense TaxID=1000413 RepID=A0A5C7IZL2_9ROSI|nr:hypothetical protein EZV62_002591 [Acer yangbiense]
MKALVKRGEAYEKCEKLEEAIVDMKKILDNLKVVKDPNTGSYSISFQLFYRIHEEMGRIKLNTDATLDLVKGKVGIGVISRDHLGDVLASSSQPLLAHFPPVVTEALAVQRGLLFARDEPMRGCFSVWWRRMPKWW